MVAKKRKKSNKATLLAILMLLVGVGVMAYPTLSNWWNKLHSSQTISAYSRYVEEIDEQQASILFARAEEYNLHIPERKLLYAPSREEKKLYPTLLNLNESGIMGYIEIPKIDVYVPIYHGTDAQTLKKAIGHIEWSALPVGGLGSHSVLSGHRGLPKAKLFTDLDKIQEGDEFVITVLNRKMTYKVDQIRIVLPSELSELQPIPNKDLCTLVTCTPYGVNTHRLLVRGVRINEEIMTPQEVHLRANAYRVPKYYALAAVLIPILFVALAVALRILGKKIREFRKRHMERAQHGKHLSLEADRESDSKRKKIKKKG